MDNSDKDKKLDEAIQKIWEVEKTLKQGSYARVELYRTRVKIMSAQGSLRQMESEE